MVKLEDKNVASEKLVANGLPEKPSKIDDSPNIPFDINRKAYTQDQFEVEFGHIEDVSKQLKE